MRGTNFFKRTLCVLLTLAMLVCDVLPGVTIAIGEASDSYINFTRVDNSEVSVGLTPGGRTEITDEPEYADSDEVRVSIVLNKKSTIDAGYSAMDIAGNQSALQYRESLKKDQTNVIHQIEKTLKSDLDVVWNLTLAANIISANVKYGQIKKIQNLPGVKSVILENQYLPCKTEDSKVSTNMATSGGQIGTGPVWDAGYTGAGMRIAVIDTGLDTNHQSLNALAFEYALGKLAEKKGMTKEDYIASLDLLDAEEIAEVADELNVTVDPEKTYINSKIAFGYNYRDFDYDVTHDNDDEGDHGSHVAGIAAANSWLVSQDGTTYGKALDYVMMQGVAPEAQLLTFKVFGKNGSPYDSDFFAAIEDAIVLGADSINLSLGSTAPGRSHHSNKQFEQIMTNLTKSGVVVSISAGNSGSWVEGSENGGYLYNTDVSMDTLGQPGAFTNSLCVGSVENDGMVGYYFTVKDQIIVYIEEPFNDMKLLRSMAGEQEYIFIDGVGKEEDWKALQDVLPGKIAICSRGETNFTEKAELAVKYGAAAVMIYNNVNGIIYLDMTEFEGTAPVVSLTKMQGAIIRENSTPVYDDEGNLRYLTGKMNISEDYGKGVFNSEYYTMSDFSSWGVTGSLEMKPEIIAPGGNIFSLEGLDKSGGAYAIKSGTSMASPQVAGMAALMMQYIRENDLEEKTEMDIRHLAQSLLMSTAHPILAAENTYYSILQQGAGLANIQSAIRADSFITMAAGSNSGAADGKVKVELFDDPYREGVYSATFTLHNLESVAKTVLLSADFFIQSPFESEGQLYMDTLTTLIGMDVVWYVDGVEVIPAALAGMDFNGDGHVNASDGQALLDYTTGVIKELNNKEKADVDGDGDIDSHDAYVFLHEMSGIDATLPADGEAEISVTFSLTEDLKESLDSVYPNGTYIQGFLFAETENEDGTAGTQHSIPVLGFYGNWTDPSMFEAGRWPTYATGEDTRIPYTGVTRVNDFKVRYAKDPNYHYSFGGNPLIPDKVYMPERDAFNSNDYFHGFTFAAIRNADQSRFVLVNETTGEVIQNQLTGPVNMTYYLNEVLGWQNRSMIVETNASLSGASEGDRITASFTLVPEYYIDSNGKVDWDALGEGATMSTSFVIDNTAPELKGVSVDLLNNTMTITASDNQYIAAAGIYNKTGTRCLASTGAKQDIEKGEVAEYTFSLDKVNGKKFLVQVFDYAMNVSTYMIEMEIGEEATIADMIAFDLVSYHWTTFTKDFAYDYKVGTPRVAYSDFTFYAATIAEHYVFASTSKGELYVMPEDDLTDTTFIVDMGVVLYDMAYNKADGEIYAVTENGDLVTIGKLTGELTKVGKIGVNTNTLACDGNGTFYCNELGTGKVYSFTLSTINNPTLLMNDPFLTAGDPITGADMGGTTGNMGMEYDPNTGMLCWNSHCEILVGSYITMAYYYEINPKTGEFTRYNDFWHEMSCLIIPDETGRNDDWTKPTNQISGVSLNKTSLKVIKGTTANLAANVQPWTAIDRTVTWTSSDASVATVDKNGMVTGVAPGTATITARSTLDPTKYATCQVTVELLEVTINGTVADEAGQPMFYSWNMATDPIWKAGAALPEVMTSATWSPKENAFYMMDTTDASVMHKIDEEGKVLTSVPSAEGIPLWDMAYSEVFSTEDQEMVTSIYYSYLLSPMDPLALDNVGFDMTSMCNYLVGITTFGYEKIEDEDGNEHDSEHLVLLDNDGYIWHFWIYPFEDGYNAMYSIINTTLDCDFPGDPSMEHMFTSLMVGEDGNLYLSTFNGETNELYFMAYDEEEEQYNAVKLCDMGMDVWPATITSVTVNGSNSTTAVHPGPTKTMSSTVISKDQLAAASKNAGKTPQTLAKEEQTLKLDLIAKGDKVVTHAEGTKTDPFIITDDCTFDLEKVSMAYFKFTAPSDGTLKMTISTSTGKWMYFVTKNEWDVQPADVEMKAGDSHIFGVRIYSGSSDKWGGCAGSVTLDLTFVTAGGETPDPEDPCTHSNAAGEWKSDDTNHWQICDTCGEEFNKAAHNYGSWVDGKKTCSDCKKEVTCVHSNAAGEWKSDDTNHWQICDTCDAEFNKDAHSYADGECTCGKADPGTDEPADPDPADTLVLGANNLSSGNTYTYTATEDGRLEFVFDSLKDSTGTQIYDHAYGKALRVKVMINDIYVPHIKTTSKDNAYRVSVSKGDQITVELVPVDTDSYTITLELSKIEPSQKLNLGDNAIEKGTDYSFIAPQDGTLYTTIKELWCDGAYCSDASLESTVIFEINGVIVNSFTNAYTVKAGDEINIMMNPYFKVSASATFHLSYEGFYEHAKGDRGNPYELNYSDCPTTTVEIPANSSVWYKLSGFGADGYLTITGANAYVVVSGTKYPVGSSGSITVPAPVWLEIGNAGNVPATFQLSASITEGTVGNPENLQEGENTVQMGASDNYYYDFVAPRDGTVTFTVSGDNWRFWLDHFSAAGEARMNTVEQKKSNNDTGIVTLEMKLGESIVIKLGTINGSWVSTGGTVTVDFYFTADGGSEECPHTNTTTKNQKDPTCTAEGYTGDKYCSVCNTLVEKGTSIPANGHTAGAEATCTMPQTCTVCGAVLKAATGHNYVDGECTNCGASDPVLNPDPENMLSLGTNSLTTGKTYTYVVTENGGLEFVFDNLRDAGDNLIYDFAYGKADRVKIFVNGVYVPNIKTGSQDNAHKVTVTKGDVVTVELRSVDGGSYTITLELAACEPATSLVLGDNAIAMDKDYSFIAPKDGTLYTTITELWCKGTYCTEASLTSSVVFRINGVVVTGFRNSYTVKAGDEITVLLGTSFGDAANARLYLSYEGFYEHPLGHRGNPHILNYTDCPTTTVEIPANTAVWYRLNGFGAGYYLTITGENAYVIISGKTYRVDSTGSLTIPATTNLQIGNEGSTPATFQLTAYIELGTIDNPEDLQEGENNVELAPSGNYYYDFIAPGNGTVTITVSGDNWRFWLDHFNAASEALMETIEQKATNNDSGTITLELTKGDYIVIKLATINGSWTSPGGNLTVDFHFEEDGACRHENAKGEWAHDENGHWQICDLCGEKFNNGSHKYESGQCVDCGKADPSNTCDHTYGEWVDGKKSCTKCGNVIICKHPTTTVKDQKDPTCTEDGYTGDTYCTVCGTMTKKGEILYATGHDFQEGVCGSCGEVDPDYRPTIIQPVINEKDTTNGVFTITWDTSKMTLLDLVVYADYYSIQIGDGFVTIGYVSLSVIPAGDPVALLLFEVADEDDADVTVDHEQINNDMPGEALRTEITSDVHTIKDGMISKIEAGTTVEELLDGINEDGVQVLDADGNVVTSGLVGTGMKVQLVVNGVVLDSLTIVVTGDINGDGKIAGTDFIQIKGVLLNKITLTGAAALAADVNGDGKIAGTDFIQIKAVLLNKGTITPH